MGSFVVPAMSKTTLPIIVKIRSIHDDLMNPDVELTRNGVSNTSKFCCKFATYKVPLNENKRCIATHDMSRIQHQGSLKTLFRDLYYSFYILTNVTGVLCFLFGKFQPMFVFFFQNRNIYGIYILTNPNFTNFFISGCR